MSQNGQTHFKKKDFYSVSDHFGTLYIKGLNEYAEKTEKIEFQ